MGGPGRGKSGGTGYPIAWRCSRCRRDYYAQPKRGLAMALHLTGRHRHEPQQKKHPRSSEWRFEYRCGDCGHVGWSRHHRAESSFRAQFGGGSLMRRLEP